MNVKFIFSENWILVVCVFLAAWTAGAAPVRGPAGEWVVLLHGLGRTSWSMKRIQWALEAAGYNVVNLSYPSRRCAVERLSEKYLHKILATKVPVAAAKVHFVTHSLGGIVLRRYLVHHSMSNLGRVVMLAPPNHGSTLADSLREHALGRWILGRAGRELGTAPNQMPQRLGPVDFPLGVIAGDVSLNPFFSRVLEGPNDGKVTVESARIAGMSDFAVVHSSHTWMMWRAETLRYILAFLREGHFGQNKT
jgi:pimeloyl-ACP methyl ester carboxylesterase